MEGYTKLYSSIVFSTIWREDDKTRLVWITMLAIADENGDVKSSIPGLADAARVSIPECEAALQKLSSPDKYSRSKEKEGRRIVEIDGGWNIVNRNKYRDIPARTEYWRNFKRKQREKKSTVDTVDKSTISTQAEAEEKEENVLSFQEKKDTKENIGQLLRFKKPEIDEITAYAKSIGFDLDGQTFYDWYESNGWKVGRNAMKDWKAAVRTWKQRNIKGKTSIQEQNNKLIDSL